MCSEDYYEEEYPENVVAFEEESPKNVSQDYEGGVEEFMKGFMKYVKREITLYFLNQTEMSTGFGGRDV